MKQFPQNSHFFGPIAITILTVFILLLVPYLSVLQLFDHYGFRTELHDLGIMEQSIWQITQGHFDMPTSYPEIGLSRLARHRNVIFYLIAPIYALAPYTETLLLLTPLSLALACILFFKAARYLMIPPLQACAFTVALGVNSFIHTLLLYDFRADTLAPPIIVGFFYSIHTRRLQWTFLLLVLLLMVKEDMAFTVVALVPWIIWRWSFPIGVTIFVSAVAYWGLVWKTLPLLMNFSTVSPFWYRFKYLGATPEQAIVNIAMNPTLALTQLSSLYGFTYLTVMAMQTGLLGMISPLLLLGAVPSILLNALDQSNWQNRLGAAYYSGIPTTILYLAVLEGYWWLSKREKKLYRAGAGGLAALFFGQAVYVGYYLAPTPVGPHVTWEDYEVDPSISKAFQEISNLIPRDATISTQNNLAPHFMRRSIVVQLASPVDKLPVDYVLFGLFPPAPRYHQLIDHLISGKLGATPNALIKMAREALQSQNFGLVKQVGPFILVKRGHDSSSNADALPLLDIARRRFSELPAPSCMYVDCIWPIPKVVNLVRPSVGSDRANSTVSTN